MKTKIVGYISLYCAIILIMALSGCASAPKFEVAAMDVDKVTAPAGTASLSPDAISELINEIEERNRTVEDDNEWIMKSYSNLMVRMLTNVSEREFESYREYLDNGAAYILVHPAFFTFFHYPKKLRDNSENKISKKNIVEELLSIKPQAPQFALLQAQERRMRDFIEFKSTENKLIIIIIPKDYLKYTGYTYRKGLDEYMRYLNEVTNLSKSVLFVESRSPNRGYLTEDNAMRLMEFLLTIKADKVYVGGGYVGRCLEDFYSLLTQQYGQEGIYVVPELADISPRELTGGLAAALLRPDGMIDEEVAFKMMKFDTYNVQETTPKLQTLK